MNRQQREQAMRLIDYLEGMRKYHASGIASESEEVVAHLAEIDGWRALLRSLAEEPQAEPVAEVRRIHWGNNPRNIGVNSLEALTDLNTLPVGAKLYTHPAAKQERLTDEQIASLAEEAFRDGFYSPRTYNDTVLNTAGEAWEEAKASLLNAWGVKL